jgi:hypothetical protein
LGYWIHIEDIWWYDKITVAREGDKTARYGSMTQTSETYVTYKQAFISGLAIIAICLSVVGLVFSILSRSLDMKVNTELYRQAQTSLCSDVDTIKTTVDLNAKELVKQGKNQLLVLRALKIEPVRE